MKPPVQPRGGHNQTLSREVSETPRPARPSIGRLDRKPGAKRRRPTTEEKRARAAYVEHLRLAGELARQMQLPDGRGRQRNAIGVVDPTGETATARVAARPSRRTTPR